jgi:hypothetical protein
VTKYQIKNRVYSALRKVVLLARIKDGRKWEAVVKYNEIFWLEILKSSATELQQKSVTTT